MLAAWNGAAWFASRMAGRRPDIPEILSERSTHPGAQPPAQMRETLLAWAARYGFKVGKYEGSVN